MLKWIGPYRITNTHKGYVFSVENLLTKQVKQIHGDRIQFYSDKSLNVTEEILNQFAYDTASRQIEKIVDAKINSTKTDIEFLIKWRVFDNIENSWCSGFSVRSENPRAIQHFLMNNLNHPLKNITTKHILPQATL